MRFLFHRKTKLFCIVVTKVFHSSCDSVSLRPLFNPYNQFSFRIEALSHILSIVTSLVVSEDKKSGTGVIGVTSSL